MTVLMSTITVYVHQASLYVHKTSLYVHQASLFVHQASLFVHKTSLYLVALLQSSPHSPQTMLGGVGLTPPPRPNTVISPPSSALRGVSRLASRMAAGLSERRHFTEMAGTLHRQAA